jgi:serine phosphatase RsbU (regulator of sigma subunit)
LAASIADLLGELLETRHALGRCEAELAAGVPMVPHREEEKHLAERLEAALLAGAEAVGCNVAALYLLDEATTKLKLRSSCGLPFDRLTAPARPLQGAVADLEALLGHAVVLNDDSLMATWNAPEDFPAAVCVPVSSPTTLLGTFWVFANEKRDFNDRETNVLEVVAGRVASDLEREMLLRSAVDGAELQKQISAADRLQRGGLPTIAPLLDGWDLAGSTTQADQVGGAFHDWFCLPDGLLATAVGRAAKQGVAGALTANTVKTALRSHAPYHRQPDRVLPQVNLTLWTGSAGDQHATLLLALLETATGRISCSSAGRPSAVLLRADGWQSLGQCSTMLGESPEAKFERFVCQLQPGETLAIFTDSIRDALDAQGRVFGEAGVANALQGKLDLTAAELVAVVQSAFAAHVPAKGHDRSILVIKRTV